MTQIYDRKKKKHFYPRVTHWVRSESEYPSFLGGGTGGFYNTNVHTR